MHTQAARMGINTTVSTDTIRGMVRLGRSLAGVTLDGTDHLGCAQQLRGMTTEEENPLLFASTYQTGDHITLGASTEAEADPAALERKRVGASSRSDAVSPCACALRFLG